MPFVVKGALLPPNRAEIDEFEAWAATIPWMTAPPSYSMHFDLRNRRDDPAKNRLIESLRISPEESVALAARDETGYRAEMAEFAATYMGPPGAELFRCGAGHGIVHRRLRARAGVHGRARARAHASTSSHRLSAMPSIVSPAYASCAPRTPSTCAAAPSASCTASASSARPSRGPSTARWTRPSSTSAPSRTLTRASLAGWKRAKKHGTSSTGRIGCVVSPDGTKTGAKA